MAALLQFLRANVAACRVAGLLGLGAIVALVSACGDDSAMPQTNVTSQQQIEQPKSADEIASGQALFSNNCSLCHGSDLRGTNTGPSLLHQYYEPNHHSNASFVIAVRRGVRQHHWDFGNMPAVENLTIEEVHAVICYIREAQLADGLIEEIPSSIPC